MVALADHFGLFQVHRCNDLVDDHRSDDFLPDRLVEAGKETLIEQADIAFAQRNILFADHGLAFQGAGCYHDFAEQFDLGGNENRPWRTAIAAHLDRDPAERLRRAFQVGAKLLAAQRHAQARIEVVDLDLVAAFGLGARQIVFNSEFKKPLGDTDKLFRQGEGISQSSSARG